MARCQKQTKGQAMTQNKEADDRLEGLRKRLVDAITPAVYGQMWVGVDEAAIASGTVFFQQHWDDDNKVVITQVIPLSQVVKPS
jgi:hypothetical protein